MTEPTLTVIEPVADRWLDDQIVRGTATPSCARICCWCC
jgi:hypothetical protein